jgi:hypothetical protein
LNFGLRFCPGPPISQSLSHSPRPGPTVSAFLESSGAPPIPLFPCGRCRCLKPHALPRLQPRAPRCPIYSPGQSERATPLLHAISFFYRAAASAMAAPASSPFGAAPATRPCSRAQIAKPRLETQPSSATPNRSRPVREASPEPSPPSRAPLPRSEPAGSPHP